MNPQSHFPAASRRETNDASGRGPGSRPPRSRGTRVAVVITATAGLALLAAACSSSPSSTDPGSPAAGGSATSSTAVAYGPVRALPRGAGLPRPYQQRVAPQDQLGAASRGQRFPAQCGTECLPGPVAVPGANPGSAAAGADRRPEVRPVHALPRGAGLPRPHRPDSGAWNSSISVSETALTRVRRRSWPRPANASTCCPRHVAAVGDGSAVRGIAAMTATCRDGSTAADNGPDWPPRAGGRRRARGGES